MQINSVEKPNYKIYPPNNKCFIKQNKITDVFSLSKNQQKVNFKGKQYPSGFYSDDEIRLAKKYLHIENYDDALLDEIWKGYSAASKIFKHNKTNENMLNTAKKVEKLMWDLKNEIWEKDRKIAELNLKITQKNIETESMHKKQKELEEKIEKEKIQFKKRHIQNEKIKNEIKNEIKKQIDLNEKIKSELARKFNLEKKIIKAKNNLTNNFINLIKAENRQKIENPLNNSSNSIFPNGIMITGMNNAAQDDLIRWCSQESDCELKEIDFEKLTQAEALKELSNTAKNAKKIYSSKGKRTLIYVKDFEKFSTRTEYNENIISKMKALLSNCSEKYNSTLVFRTNNPEKLDTEIMADHRFPIKINLGEKISLFDFLESATPQETINQIKRITDRKDIPELIPFLNSDKQFTEIVKKTALDKIVEIGRKEDAPLLKSFKTTDENQAYDVSNAIKDLKEKPAKIKNHIDRIINKSKEILINKFINPAKFKKYIGTPDLPSEIIITGMNNLAQDNLIEWIIKESKCNLKEIDFEKLTHAEVLKELNNTAEDAKETFSKTGKSSIIYVKNFEKFSIRTEENENIIRELGKFSYSCAWKFNSTLIFKTNNLEKIDFRIRAIDNKTSMKIDLGEKISLFDFLGKETPEETNEQIKKITDRKDIYELIPFLNYNKKFTEILKKTVLDKIVEIGKKEDASLLEPFKTLDEKINNTIERLKKKE